MTFSIIARCRRTGQLGYAQATGTPAIGRRVMRVVPKRFVIAVQAGHNHYLLEMAYQMALLGTSAERINSALTAADPNFAQRQTMFLAAEGPGFAYTGDDARDWKGHAVSEDCVVAGNVLAGPKVVESMRAAFEDNANEELAERLMRALEAGRREGGQSDGERSAALYVMSDVPYPLIDLRVDVSMNPTADLRKAFDWYKPLVPFYAECYEQGTPARYKQHLTQIKWPVDPVL